MEKKDVESRVITFNVLIILIYPFKSNDYLGDFKVSTRVVAV